MQGFRVTAFAPGIKEADALELEADRVFFVNNSSYGPLANFGQFDEVGAKSVVVNLAFATAVEVERIS